jgi:hypothetical protein
VEVVLCSTVTVESIWEARQNEGFGLLLPVNIITDNTTPDLVSFGLC